MSKFNNLTRRFQAFRNNRKVCAVGATMGRIGGAAAIASLNVSNAYAAAMEPQELLKKLAEFIVGPLGSSIAVLGIMGIGLAWMFGRASLGLVASVVGGIVIVFGAGAMAKTGLGLAA